MSRDTQLACLHVKGLILDDTYIRAIDMDMISYKYEKLMKEKFPLLKLDYSDVYDVTKEDGRITNLYERLKVIDELGCNDINKDDVLAKIESFIRVYLGYINTNPEGQLDADEDILLFSLYRKFIPRGYIFYTV